MGTFRHILLYATTACALVGYRPEEAKATVNFGIEPLRLELSAARKSGTLRLFNRGDAPVLVQVDAVSWAQTEGQDVLEATQGLLVSPPLFRILPKGVQTIRVGYSGKPDAMRETTYRVLIREVSEQRPEQSGVATRLQISLPVFIAPQQPAKPQLVWRLVKITDGKLRLTAHNQGTSHAQIAAVDLTPLVLEPNATPAGYLLHGQSRFWEWASKEMLPARLTVSYRLNGQPVQAEVGVGN